MTWRVAYSLNVLLAQLNDMYPKRDKASDGSIGDAAHASRDSDHNPDEHEIVRARDFTHDPDNGINCHKLAAWLVASRDPRIKYIIWNGFIWQYGVWRPYYGPNPHTKHLHLSVIATALADSAKAWNLRKTPGVIMRWTDKIRARRANRAIIDQTAADALGQIQAIWDCVRPGDKWRVRDGWLQAGLSEMQGDHDKILAALKEINGKLDSLKESDHGQ